MFIYIATDYFGFFFKSSQTDSCWNGIRILNNGMLFIMHSVKLRQFTCMIKEIEIV